MSSIRSEYFPIGRSLAAITLAGAFSSGMVNASHSEIEAGSLSEEANVQRVIIQPGLEEASRQLGQLWAQDLQQPVTQTPIMEEFSARIDALWELAESGELELTPAEEAFAERLLELYPND